MTRAVLDANTIVSAVLAPLGNPARLLAAARAGRFTLIASEPIVAEVRRVLGYDRIRRKYQITPAEIARLRELLEGEGVLGSLTHDVRGVATHPEDDLVLATALSSQAEFLVTGDKQLLRLGAFEHVAIVSPRQFLELLEHT